LVAATLPNRQRAPHNRSAGAPRTMLARPMIARTAASALLGRLRAGRIEIVESDGSSRVFGPAHADLAATIRVHDPAFWRALTRGSRALAKLYTDGGWDCDEVVTAVRIAARELPRLDRLRAPFAPLRSALTRVPLNTREGARRHISAHYDLGNDMFRLFLDESMTYSCAYFEEPGMTLHDAQLAKLDRICRKLELNPDDHLVEIGSGWGSLALHAAGEYGCRVTTTTISREQHAVARERVRAAGLDDRVEVVMEDYRDLRGSYSKLASVEMIEAVGWQYFDLFFRSCSNLLAPDGLMLLQAITIADTAYEIEKASRSFAKELIFPSGCLPSVEVISRSVAGQTDMRLLDLEDITAHYPPTLAAWRANFTGAVAQLEELGYDRRFRRMWELYLSWSEGGFRERRVEDYQLLLAKPAYRAARTKTGLDSAVPTGATPRRP
jgi:cyclopropane-fatty-acyl-phospholipid synthase